MPVGSYTINARQGNRIALTFQFNTSDGTPRDFTTYTLHFLAVTRDGGTTIEYYYPGGDLGADPDAGQITLTLTETDTASLPLGPATRYEIEARSGSGEESLIAGVINIARGVNENG